MSLTNMNCLKCKNTIDTNPLYGLHETCFKNWFGLTDAITFHDLDPKSSSSTPSHHEIKKKKDTFFHGRYLKYSARLGSTTYILKVQEDEFPELPIVEYLCNGIASLLGIYVPAYYLINFNNRITFVTRNFMQDHVGTLNHLYKFLPEGEQHHNCEEIINVILTKTSKLSDVVKFIEICLFDALIGNNDRHGRNIGIIETAQGSKLAPMYDNPSILGIQEDFILGAHFNPSGSIWTHKSKEPKPIDYMDEFERLGHKRIVIQFCSKVISQSTNIIDLIKNTDIGEKRKNALLKLLTARIEDFTNVKKS